MIGPQHYQAAERALSNSRETYQNTAEERDQVRTLLAEAQVHATLALAAAIAEAGHLMEPGWDGKQMVDVPTEWSRVVGGAA